MTRRLIGIGNPDRGDDAAGWEVAAQVTQWQVSRRTTGSFDMLDIWDENDDVVIVDAMHSGSTPGTVKRFDARTDELPIGTFASTHSFGPAALVELARAMDRLPRTLVVYGIEAGNVDHGAALSSEVAHAVLQVADELQRA
ncbi:MAG: hydrogenase maturation protease [Actinomycetia bacterium]|nr:hydrogenase maturation protease [Actinomycetes bacterium]